MSISLIWEVKSALPDRSHSEILDIVKRLLERRMTRLIRSWKWIPSSVTNRR